MASPAHIGNLSGTFQGTFTIGDEESVSISHVGDDAVFKDTNNPGGFTLSQLAQGDTVDTILASRNEGEVLISRNTGDILLSRS